MPNIADNNFGAFIQNHTNGMDVNDLRPWIENDGRAYINVYNGSGDRRDIKNYSVRQVNNGTLRRDEWIELDRALVGFGEDRLSGINDLVRAGLVYNLGGMGATVLEWHEIGDALEAETNMDGVPRAKADRVEYATNYIPLPFTHAHYQLNARALETSRRMGVGLDTSMAERAARKVLEKLEKHLFTNITYKYASGTVYSYINHTDRNTVSFENSRNWVASAKTNAGIITDVLAMKKAMIDDHFYGPFVIYIPTAYTTVLDKDYDNTRGNTLRERILAIDSIQSIRVADLLPDNNIVMVSLTSDVVRLIQAVPMTNIEYSAEGPWATNYAVFTIQIPQIRSDAKDQMGLVHMT